MAEHTILWNAVPWHPPGADGLHSNRTPTTGEIESGMEYLDALLVLFPGVRVGALGNIAARSLGQLEREHQRIRHPANGGATKFRNGLAALIARTAS